MTGSREEVERIRRVSDQLCSAHAALRDRYARFSTFISLAILLASAWLMTLAFVDPKFDDLLVPFDWSAKIWTGVLGLGTFCLTLLQLNIDWRSKSEAHNRSFCIYSEVKREAGYILASSDATEPREFQRLTARYDMASDVGTAVPESEFLRLKRHHKLKVEISKLLDHKPGTSVLLTKFRLFLRDNCSCR